MALKKCCPLTLLLFLVLGQLALAETRVRIALQEKGSSCTVESEAYTLKATAGAQVLRKGQGQVTFRPGFPEKDVMLVPASGVFTWNGRGYRGYLRVFEREGKLVAVNVLNLEDYLAGVVGGEIPADWPGPTQRALAVAARTYAVYLLGDPRDSEYDLVATDQDQVYAGLDGESFASRGALDDTRGQVLKGADGRVLKAYYSSSCGGHTSDSEPVFGPEVPSIKGVPDPYCAGTAGSHWSRSFPIETVRKRFAADGKPLAKITSVQVSGYDPSGRMSFITVKDDQGHEYREKSQDFRRILGYRELRSTRCKMTVKEQSSRPVSLHFQGGGWGHGVGLCQWGALVMGEKHMGYQAILRHYYRGATLEKI